MVEVDGTVWMTMFRIPSVWEFSFHSTYPCDVECASVTKRRAVQGLRVGRRLPESQSRDVESLIDHMGWDLLL